jgi:hypothetical protein
MNPPVFYIEKAAHLRYLHIVDPSANVFVSRIEELSRSREVGLLLKSGADDYGWTPINLHQVNDAREIDYCLCALQQTLERILGEDAVAVAVAVEEEEKALDLFSTRLSVDRCVCDDEGVRAVVNAVRGVVRAARSPSPCVEDHQAVAEADLPRAVTAVRGVARAVLNAVRGIVRTAPSPRDDDDSDSGADLVRAACSPRIHDLVRAALGEVRAARARPVQLQDDRVPLHVTSLQEVQEVLAAGPPHPRGVWSTARVLHVRFLQHLSGAYNLEHDLHRCSRLGWRIPSLERLGQVRKLDCQLVLLYFKLKAVFDGSIAGDDVSLHKESVDNRAKELVRVCTDEVMLFQAEIATIPDVISELLSADDTEQVRGSANRAMAIIRRIRTEEVKL